MYKGQSYEDHCNEKSLHKRFLFNAILTSITDKVRKHFVKILKKDFGIEMDKTENKYNIEGNKGI